MYIYIYIYLYVYIYIYVYAYPPITYDMICQYNGHALRWTTVCYCPSLGENHMRSINHKVLTKMKGLSYQHCTEAGYQTNLSTLHKTKPNSLRCNRKTAANYDKHQFLPVKALPKHSCCKSILDCCCIWDVDTAGYSSSARALDKKCHPRCESQHFQIASNCCPCPSLPEGQHHCWQPLRETTAFLDGWVFLAVRELCCEALLLSSSLMTFMSLMIEACCCWASATAFEHWRRHFSKTVPRSEWQRELHII